LTPYSAAMGVIRGTTTAMALKMSIIVPTTSKKRVRTIKKVVRWTTGWLEDRDGTETPRLDADLLASHVLGISRVELYTQMDEELSDDELTTFKQLIKRRAAGEPVAYLIGYREFRNLALRTDDRALIPRPDTETVIDVVLELIPAADALDDPLRMADVGTGTGAISLALFDERPDLRIAATDTSEEALSLARENIDGRRQPNRPVSRGPAGADSGPMVPAGPGGVESTVRGGE